MNLLEKIYNKTPFESYILHSRVHLLNMLSNVYIKRDDELSCTISGSKLRKYATLLPFLKALKLKQTLLIGGAQSNNILGLSQLLIENGIQPILFLRKPAKEDVKGNFLLIKTLVDEKYIHWIDRVDWQEVTSIAEKFCKKLQKPIKIIPEGAMVFPSLIGAMTLSSDIQQNQWQNNISFDHIFVDAGTGMQAIALILGNALLGSIAKIHVLLLAVKEEEFLEQLHLLKKELLERYKIEDFKCENFMFHLPTNAASFGSVNKSVMDKINMFAKEEGIILDPIYSAKLLFESEKIIQQENFKGKSLIVHSGGCLSFFGYN